jgi:hypothetical protein
MSTKSVFLKFQLWGVWGGCSPQPPPPPRPLSSPLVPNIQILFLLLKLQVLIFARKLATMKECFVVFLTLGKGWDNIKIGKEQFCVPIGHYSLASYRVILYSQNDTIEERYYITEGLIK